MSNVDRVYARVKEMAILYEFRPGERLNEVQLSERLNTSRTPLREALNRLATEGFLTFTSKPGFYCRTLTPQDVNDLYESRIAIESQTAKLAIERSTDKELIELRQLVSVSDSQISNKSEKELLEEDEEFHLKIATLSKNLELKRILLNINERIHFIRSIDRNRRKYETEEEHRMLVNAIINRDQNEAVKILEQHIYRRMEDITEVIKIGVAQIYMRDLHK